MSRKKIRHEGRFVRERQEDPAVLRLRGFTRFRTVVANRHRIIMAFAPGRRVKGTGVVQAILHPESEIAEGKFVCALSGACKRVG